MTAHELQVGDVVHFEGDPSDLGDVFGDFEDEQATLVVIWRRSPDRDLPPDYFDPMWPLEGPPPDCDRISRRGMLLDLLDHKRVVLVRP